MIPFLFLIFWFHTAHTVENAPRDKQDGLVHVAVPRKCFRHARVWLNGRELKHRTDFWATEAGIVPSKTVYAEWMEPRAVIKVRF